MNLRAHSMALSPTWTDAVTVADMVRERFGTQDIRINFVGPVIGAHSGPGTLALFYLGTER